MINIYEEELGCTPRLSLEPLCCRRMVHRCPIVCRVPFSERSQLCLGLLSLPRSVFCLLNGKASVVVSRRWVDVEYWALEQREGVEYWEIDECWTRLLVLVKDGWPPFLLPFFPPLYDFLLPTTPSCPCRFVVETSHRTCWLPLVLAPFLLHYKKHPQEKAWRLFFPCWIFVLRPTVVQTRTTFLELQRPPPRVSRRARSTQAYSFTAADTISTGSILFTHTREYKNNSIDEKTTFAITSKKED